MKKTNLFRDLLSEIDETPESPGKTVRAIRKHLGLTLKDVEEITGIAESNLSSIENDKIDITKHYAEVLGVVLGLHPSSILYPNGTFKKDKGIKEIENKAKKFIHSKVPNLS